MTMSQLMQSPIAAGLGLAGSMALLLAIVFGLA